MNAIDLRILLMAIVIAIVVIVPIAIIRKIVKKSKKASHLTVRPESGPYISVEYVRDFGPFEDGNGGWLDIECESGEEMTVDLRFNKKAPQTIFIPLKIAKYRITYRSKSKTSMAASGILTAINENNGAMGAFANAVYDAGGMNGQLSSVIVDVDADFVLKLACTTDGIERKCKVIS